jgi:sirohydrochlorin ferrochelatase
MTTTDPTTPDTGNDSTDFERGTYPLADAPDDDLADTLENHADDLADDLADVVAALRGESDPLTDQQLERVQNTTESLLALAETAAFRVPPHHREDPDVERHEPADVPTE